MKTVRDEMDIVQAYQTVGTYRGAAALSGTTHKTVRRVIERRGRQQAGRVRTRDAVTTPVLGLVEDRVR